MNVRRSRHGDDAIPPHIARRAVLIGTVAAALSGVGYATATVIARSLARDGLGATTVLSLRFGIGGVLLALLALATGRSLVPARGERLAAALLGTVGYAVESSLFFAGLERGSAAAVTVLFYAYPVVVALVELAARMTTLTPRLAGALTAGAAGTAVVVVAGADVTVSTGGIAFALAASVAFALYLLASARHLVRTDTIVRAAWVSAGAAVGLVVRGLLAGDFDSPAGAWPRLVGIGVANAVAFGLLFSALGRVGATRTAVVLNIEPVAAVVLAAAFLGETLGGWQLAGGSLVLAAAVAVALPERRRRAGRLPVHPPP